jgi:ElaB/YqjD/DUF883 family membrane-anchored ribosome-binding protein
MRRYRQAINTDLSRLAEDARALMAATADVAGEKVGDARKRLAGALECFGEIYGDVRKYAAEEARAADRAVRENPYQAIAIGVGVGALLGFVLSGRFSRKCD